VGDDQLRPVLPPDAPAALATLAAACFEPMPEHRPSFALIAHHMRKARSAPGAPARLRVRDAYRRARSLSAARARRAARRLVRRCGAAPGCTMQPASEQRCLAPCRAQRATLGQINAGQEGMHVAPSA